MSVYDGVLKKTLEIAVKERPFVEVLKYPPVDGTLLAVLPK
jgi:hypothetical protein